MLRIDGPRALLLLGIGVLSTACDSSTAPAKPGPPARIEITAGDAQSALAGTAVPQGISVTVRDAKGMLVPNKSVTFSVAAGGGSVTPASVTTDQQGVAGGVSWTLGTRGGEQRLTATADTVATNISASIKSSFTLTLRFFGPTMSTEAQAAFTNAANRIRAAIVGQISSVPLAAQGGADLARCGVSGLTGVLQETVPGVIIYASVGPIDQAGKILAQAGPCYVRQTSDLPIIGVMKFDEADIQNYINTGRFESIVLHEMNHVVGFGTIWLDKNLLTAPAWDYPNPQSFPDSVIYTGSLNPRFAGATSLTRCLSQPGATANHCASGVGIAVEQCGEAGTADGHWREVFTTTCTGTNRAPVGGNVAFDNELMTGYVEGVPNMPWSAMTIAQFQDLGYTVNLLAADNYTVPSLMSTARMRSAMDAAAGEGPAEQLLRPRFMVGGGRIQAIRREIRR